MLDSTIARRYEKEGNWLEALKAWTDLHRYASPDAKPYYKENLDAVQMIVDSNRAGDEWRERMKFDPDHIKLCLRVKMEKGEPFTEEDKKNFNLYFK